MAAMHENGIEEWLREGMSSPFEGIGLGMLFSALKTLLMSLQTTAGKDFISHTVRQISMMEMELALIDLVFGFLIGFTNILWGLAYLAGFMFVWIAFHPTLASLGFTNQDAILTIVPVSAGIVLRFYLKHRINRQQYV
jgi:hypothetical protein